MAQSHTCKQLALPLHKTHACTLKHRMSDGLLFKLGVIPVIPVKQKIHTFGPLGLKLCKLTVKQETYLAVLHVHTCFAREAATISIIGKILM